MADKINPSVQVQVSGWAELDALIHRAVVGLQIVRREERQGGAIQVRGKERCRILLTVK